MKPTATDCTDGGGLTPKQRKAAALLAQGENLTEVARALRVDRSTIWRWRNTAPDFSLLVEKTMRSHEEEADLTLRASTAAATDRLRELLSCGNPSVELGAARQILQAWERMVHRRQLEEEVEELRGVVADLSARESQVVG